MNELQRYPDLAAAGVELAGALAAHAGRPDVVVLGLARGGVPAAVEVARRLRLPLDVVLLRRLMISQGVAIPASVFNLAGTRVMDQSIAEEHSPRVQVYLEETMAEFARREQAARGGRPPLDLEGKTLLLVDNGVRTGGTLRMSIRALRALFPARIVVAVPFASVDARGGLEAAADEVVCPVWHDWDGTVAVGYRRFDVPDYEKIGEMLSAAVPG